MCITFTSRFPFIKIGNKTTQNTGFIPGAIGINNEVTGFKPIYYPLNSLPKYTNPPPPPQRRPHVAHLTDIKTKVIERLLIDLKGNINPKKVENYILFEDNSLRLVQSMISIPQVRTQEAFEKSRYFGIRMEKYLPIYKDNTYER